MNVANTAEVSAQEGFTDAFVASLLFEGMAEATQPRAEGTQAGTEGLTALEEHRTQYATQLASSSS